MSSSPTTPPPQPRRLNRVLDRNIEELRRRRAREEGDVALQDRVAAAITGFAGTMAFAYAHLAVVAAWTSANLGWLPHVPRFDASFVGLATVASVEGIFLTTFVLITQNRDAGRAERRAELDLQINLLAEHEVTKLISLVRALAEHQGVRVDPDEVDELERDVDPGSVANALEERSETPP